MACALSTSQAVLRTAAVNTRSSRAAPAPIAHLSSKKALGGNAVAIARQTSRAQAVGAARSTARRSGAVKVAAAISNRPWAEHNARLVLADGSVFTGIAFGAEGTVVQEVVFNTSLSGYQEIMTDPSYAGQAVCFTCPHIGNVGINEDDMESEKCHLGAVIIRSYTTIISNYRSEKSLDTYLKEQNVIGITDVDTRELTRRIRDKGALVGVISTEASKTDDELLDMAKGWSIEGKDYLSVVTCDKPYEWKDPTIASWEFNTEDANTNKYHVVAYDYGIKTNILRRLASYGCKVTVVPGKTPADEVLAMNPDGVFFSNGPGDPSAAPWAVANAEAILGKVPVFGICMGHQVLGQAFGGKTYKLPFGHHGGNHPISHQPTGRVEISAQNHNYAVDPKTLPAGVEVTHINLNDGTCAGMVWADKKAMTIQYHPEASPGPHDSDVSFEDFVKMMAAEKN
uniref:Carbamoyl phosphate synthase arginine-specific small chain n=1 Tax=Pyramimonas obovata TaxID=1411642 RepID=A0A7S0R4H5_9CHLO|mmetsp:Transcript_25397/g.55217  ORF Transcript_25397/g.55217 Transcript_25397/m.55217 type:complete len:455 (+) Transcript_25397:153-1517(+)|eukprot:CAMPEP_0118933244 /NCGR_PEP_ID=MMETSP1169-20130426/11784_1 /TAXON_ID=36882 /ORGANISM="Pyramimonas obovata, Strain CCMP722" /LENGTH=454 /DNA_ID=CAMNT_0006875983 /DNA_START=128 /DNA_END=1492 /DNA_ORIENTATION=+